MVGRINTPTRGLTKYQRLSRVLANQPRAGNAHWMGSVADMANMLMQAYMQSKDSDKYEEALALYNQGMQNPGTASSETVEVMPKTPRANPLGQSFEDVGTQYNPAVNTTINRPGDPMQGVVSSLSGVDNPYAQRMLSDAQMKQQAWKRNVQMQEAQRRQQIEDERRRRGYQMDDRQYSDNAAYSSRAAQQAFAMQKMKAQQKFQGDQSLAQRQFQAGQNQMSRAAQAAQAAARLKAMQQGQRPEWDRMHEKYGQKGQTPLEFRDQYLQSEERAKLAGKVPGSGPETWKPHPGMPWLMQSSRGNIKAIPSSPAQKLQDAVRVAVARGAAQGKYRALTEQESKSGSFALRMHGSGNTLDTLTKAGYALNIKDYTAIQGVLRGFPGANYALSNEGQKYFQAMQDWVTANLRKESGAVIGKEEMAQEMVKYFPLPGDSEAVKRQKRASRVRAFAGMKTSAGKAYKLMYDTEQKLITDGWGELKQKKVGG